MCLLCIEVAKENISPKDFWKNYRELVNTDENGHWKEVIETVNKTSFEYQRELAEGNDE